MGTENNTEVTKATTVKQTKRTRELLEEYNKRMEELKQEHAGHEAALADILKEREQLGFRDATGLVVKHSKFGEGTVSRQREKYIDVQFENVVKKFVLPGAIADKYLSVDDEEVLSYYQTSNEFHLKTVQEQLAIRSTEFAMDRLQEKIDKLEGKE